MIQTTKEQLDYIVSQIMPTVLEHLREYGVGVGEIELAASLTGVNSLPALKREGGVDKVVEVPLDLLMSDVNQAVADCKEATQDANIATAAANDAAESVTEAILDISEEKQAAIAAASAANTAAAAANQAKSDCDEATTACLEATELCRNETTECIDATSACRNATQECINETSNTRSATVEAKNAATKANSEASNLSALKTACQEVTTRCDSTNSTAEEKIVEMESLLKSISAEANASPVRMQVSFPVTISTKNKVAQRIVANLFPSYVMNNVLFQRSEGNSLSVDPSGLLKVAGTGTTSFYVIPTQNTELWQQVDISVRGPLIRLSSTGKMRLNGNYIRLT